MDELIHVLHPIFERGAQSLKATPPTTIVRSALTTRLWPTRLNGLALPVRYHTASKTASRFWAGTIIYMSTLAR